MTDLDPRRQRLWGLHDFSCGRGLEIGPLHNPIVRTGLKTAPASLDDVCVYVRAWPCAATRPGLTCTVPNPDGVVALYARNAPPATNSTSHTSVSTVAQGIFQDQAGVLPLLRRCDRLIAFTRFLCYRSALPDRLLGPPMRQMSVRHRFMKRDHHTPC